MNEQIAPMSYLRVFGFGILVLVPSFDSVLKYGGPAGLVAFFIFGTVFLLLGYRFLLPAFLNRVTERTALVLTVLTFAFLTVITAVGYQIANSGRLGGGSDIDDALIIGAGELLSGNYPYYKQTYLGGWLTPLPGAIILAVPFVLLDLLPYQNIFWLGVLFLVARRQLGSIALTLAMLWTILLIAPSFYQSLLTGSDHIANTIYVLIGMWFMITELSDHEAPVWKRALPAIFLGIGLSSRSNFLFITPILFALLTQLAGWKIAAKYCALTAVTFLLVTVPFWIYDPAGFSPLFVQASKVSMFEDVLPYAKYLVPFSAMLLALVLSLRDMKNELSVFFTSAAIVQLYIILVTSVLYALTIGKFTLFLSTVGYGLFAFFFAMFGGWVALKRRPMQRRPMRSA